MDPIALYLVFAMLATMWLDVTRYTIPNWLVGSLLLLYPVAVYLSPDVIEWEMALAAMGLVFVVGCIIFMLRVMGGGDIKLITVLALWVCWNGLLDFVLLFAILGGVFSILLIIGRRMMVYAPIDAPRVLQKNAPIPYGVAIALAFLWLMQQDKIPMVAPLQIF